MSAAARFASRIVPRRRKRALGLPKGTPFLPATPQTPRKALLAGDLPHRYLPATSCHLWKLETRNRKLLLSPRRMRAAAILGLGSSETDLKPFRQASSAIWTLGMPAHSADADAVLVFGGDGTLHRHLANLVRLSLPVLAVPCGSGNDFARALRLGTIADAVAAWREFCSAAKNAKTIDLGVISPLAPAPSDSSHTDASRYSPPGTRHYFCSVGGVGLDAETARRANRLPPWLRGHGGYALSLPAALFRFAPHRMRISRALPDQPEQLAAHLDQPVLMAAFANTPVYGGGMKIAPRAQMDDGQLDVCIVREVGKLKVLRLFPTVYFGRHLNIPQVDYFQAARLRIETEAPLDVYADGEYVCHTPIDVSLARGGLRVIVPSNASF